MRSFAERHWPIGLFLAVVACAALPATWSGELADLGGDSAIYVLTARHYGSWLVPDAIAAGFARESQFPPLYPLLLTVTGGAWDLRIAHAATTACVLLAVAAVYASALALGLSRWLALSLAAVFALMPGTLVPALTLKSEPLYLALTLGGFAYLARAVTAGSGRHYWAATALFSAAVLARSVGVALVPALLVALVVRRPAGWPWMLACMAMPGMAWIAFRSGHAYGATYADYGNATIGDIAGHVLFNLEAFGWGIAGNLVETHALAPWLVPVALPFAVVLVHRFATLQPDAWYVAGYLAIMAVWPYPSEAQRFAWVIMPWVLAYPVCAARWAASRISQLTLAATAMRWAVPAIFAMLVIPAFQLAVQRWFEPTERALAHLPEWYGVDRKGASERARTHLDTARGLAQLGAQIPAGECLFSIRPAVIAMYSGRDGYLAPFERLGDADFEGLLRARKCRYFMLLEATDGDTFRTPFYPRDRLQERLAIVGIHTSGLPGATRVVVALAKLES